MTTILDDFLRRYAPTGRQAAADADRAADAMDRATRRQQFDAGEEDYEAAREKLLQALLSLGADGAKCPAWTADGLGLLSVPSFLQQRDPSLYGLYHRVRGMIALDAGAGEFACSVEAHLLVYPDRGPLRALVEGCRRLSRVSGFTPEHARHLFESLVLSLRGDDFWVPQGTSSLDGFLKKLSAALSESTLDAPPLAAVAPEKTVREQLARHGWEWAKLRDDLKETNLDLLVEILRFRSQLTRELMEKARDETAKWASPRYGERYRWVLYSAPGSERPTSDIDVNTKGTGTEKLVQNFNILFRNWTLGLDEMGQARKGLEGPRAKVELESGYVFDVNVYANDYLARPDLRFLAPRAPAEDLWPDASTAKGERHEAERQQDLYALLKVRRYMTDDEWGKFCKQLLAAIGRKDETEAKSRLSQVGKLWNELQQQLAKKVAALAPRFEDYPGNGRMRAENDLYQEQLDKLEGIRYNGGKPLSARNKVDLARELGRADFLAQEAYHTAGAVRDVVANMQMRSGLDLTDAELLASVNEQAGDIFKELHHFEHEHAGAAAGSDLDFAVTTSKYMVRLGNAAATLNYRVVNHLLVRQVDEAQRARRMFEKKGKKQDPSQVQKIVDEKMAQLSKGVNALVEDLLDLQDLVEKWRASTRELLEIKDADPTTLFEKFKEPDRKAWSAEAKRRLDATPWRQKGGANLRSFLIKLTAASNAQLRGKLRSGALSRFLRDSLAASIRATKMPAGSAAAAPEPH